MHEKAVKAFSDLVDHLCILAPMIDICLCSNVYSPLTSRPQIWSTRERGENVSAIRRSYMVSFYAWVVKASRCKLQAMCLRAHLSFKGQVLRTNNFVMKKCLHFSKNSAPHLWIVIARWCHTCWVVFQLFLVTLLVFFYFILERKLDNTKLSRNFQLK